MRTFQFILRTPDKVLYEGPIGQLSARAADGSIGILAGHAPLLSALDVGILRATIDGGELLWAAGDSLMNVGPDRVEV
ncbi:MAG: F0F1 ATP synthase subunit epsilon, partial [Verrucomicrobia bacterium]|nr:F0F1 ATP synthase subunit epsilon [Verrucomicrobiota bacterium]